MADTNQFSATQAGTMSPEDYAQQQALNRQQRFADLLMAQGQQPAGQMISGRYVPPSFFQMLNPVVNQLAGAYIGKKGDEEATKLAQKLRTQEMSDIQKYGELYKGTSASPEIRTELAGPYGANVGDGLSIPKPEAVTPARAATPANPEAANLFAASSYSPVLRAMGLKRITEGPKWEKAVMPMPDGSEKHGWVDYNSPNPKNTFVEGGTKPAYTALEGARFTYDTGMQPPTGAPQGQARPVQAMPTQPVQNATIQNAPVQTSAPMSNRQPVQAVPMSNQVNPAVGNAVPVSAMNRPAMSPKQQGEANQAVYTEQEKERQKSLKQLPTDINQAEQAIATVNQMIGDARLNDKGEVVYQKYDPTSKKWVAGAEPHGGFENYVGATMFPYLSNVHGTDTADFRTLYDSLKGQAFLEAFARIKGAGAITEVEGAKATQALLKLNNAQSEKEFIKYAREFQENAQKGMALAKEKAGVSQNYRSPVNQPALRWNPQTNSWVQ